MVYFWVDYNIIVYNYNIQLAHLRHYSIDEALMPMA